MADPETSLVLVGVARIEAEQLSVKVSDSVLEAVGTKDTLSPDDDNDRDTVRDASLDKDGDSTVGDTAKDADRVNPRLTVITIERVKVLLAETTLVPVSTVDEASPDEVRLRDGDESEVNVITDADASSEGVADRVDDLTDDSEFVSDNDSDSEYGEEWVEVGESLKDINRGDGEPTADAETVVGIVEVATELSEIETLLRVMLMV